MDSVDKAGTSYSDSYLVHAFFPHSLQRPAGSCRFHVTE
jgi:hypothetical protein